MPLYTIERTYRLPIYQHRTYHDKSVEGACRQALDDDDWSDEKQDYETAGQTYISGIWSGETAAYKGDAIPIPANFADLCTAKPIISTPSWPSSPMWPDQWVCRVPISSNGCPAPMPLSPKAMPFAQTCPIHKQQGSQRKTRTWTSFQP